MCKEHFTIEYWRQETDNELQWAVNHLKNVQPRKAELAQQVIYERDKDVQAMLRG